MLELVLSVAVFSSTPVTCRYMWVGTPAVGKTIDMQHTFYIPSQIQWGCPTNPFRMSRICCLRTCWVPSIIPHLIRTSDLLLYCVINVVHTASFTPTCTCTHVHVHVYIHMLLHTFPTLQLVWYTHVFSVCCALQQCYFYHYLQLLVRVSNVHTVFVTGLAFIPVATAEAVTSSPDKQVSKPDKLALISVSADRTCSATLVRRQSGTDEINFRA